MGRGTWIKKRDYTWECLSHDYPRDILELYLYREPKVGIAFTDLGVLSWARKVLSGDGDAKRKIILGKLKKETTDRIFKDTGIDLSGYDLSYSQDFVRHFYKRHVLNLAGQIKCEIEDMAKIPDLVASYRSIRVNTDGCIIFEKNLGKVFRFIAAFSIRHGDVCARTFMQQKKRSTTPQAVHDGVPSLSPCTSETTSRVRQVLPTLLFYPSTMACQCGYPEHTVRGWLGRMLTKRK